MTKVIRTRKLPCEATLRNPILPSLKKHRVKGDLIKLFEWDRYINKREINRVVRVNNKGRTRSDGLKMDRFSFKKELGRH